MELVIDKPKFAKNSLEEDIFKSIRSEVNQYLHLNKKSNNSLVFKGGVFGSLFILSYIGILLSQTYSFLIFSYLSLGLILVLLGLNFAHDFSHNTIFKSKKINNTFFEGLFMLMGINGYLWKKRHTHSHHNYPNTEGYDVDIELGSIVHLAKSISPKKYHKWQHVYAPFLYGIYTLYWVFYKDFKLFFQKQHANLMFKKHSVKEHLKFWIFKGFYVFYLVIIPMFYTPFSVFQILLAFLIFHLLVAWFLLFTFLITHHVEKTEYFNGDKGILNSSSWMLHQVKSSNDFHPFKQWANFIFGGFNCHVAHHLFPNASHIYYPEISKIIYKKLYQNNIIPNTTTFLGGIKSHIRLLKKLGKNTE